MGLFGPKIAKEEKMYQKALKDALHKPNTKNINALKSAMESYPNSWQGYWICAVYHDQGFDKTARDEAKAQEYFKKAEALAKGTDHEVWMQEFLTWYRRDAGHLEKPMTEASERTRRLGIALCYCSLLGDLFLTAPYEKYCGDGYAMNWGIIDRANGEYEDRAPFRDFIGVSDIDRNSQIKDTNGFFDKSNKSVDAYVKCVEAIRNGKEPNWEKYNDMYDYLIAVNCIHGGKLLTEEVAQNSGYLSETEMGINRLILCSSDGSQPAIHEITRLAKASQNNFEVVERAFLGMKINTIWGGDLDRFLMEKLERCMEKNDAEAANLYQMYYR